MNDIVNDLKNIEDRHKNDTVFTGSIYIALMAYECRREIEILREDLKAYRATGLSPERVAELAEAEKDGRLVVLPCKVGDIVYQIYPDGTEIFNGGTILYFYSSVGLIFFKTTNGTFQTDDFGKNVFITRAEAEAALAELKEGGE